VTLIGELMWLEPKEKNYMCGLMHLLDTFHTKEWALEKEKIGNLTGRSRHKVGSLYRKDNIVFHCVIFPAMLKLKEALFYQKMFLQMSS
jgi:methionyl-tRNA synthetase